MSVDDLGVTDAVRQGAHGYEASNARPVRRLLRSIPDDLSTFTFIDIGSGKGAVLIAAARFPFRRVLGIELSPALHAIAVANLAITADAHECTDVSSTVANAVEFPIPAEPLVLYFCNPFEPAVFTMFLARVYDSIDHAPRPVYVLTLNPYRSQLDAEARANRIGGGWGSSAYRLSS